MVVGPCSCCIDCITLFLDAQAVLTVTKEGGGDCPSRDTKAEERPSGRPLHAILLLAGVPGPGRRTGTLGLGKPWSRLLVTVVGPMNLPCQKCHRPGPGRGSLSVESLFRLGLRMQKGISIFKESVDVDVLH